ncbi:hypothetical protein A0U90_07075 [Kozakia baliensis]|nr:hypothetical protein A0U90_07075 [Kozakia baliensis]
MHSPIPDVRRRAANLHERLMAQGRIPLLSWHHIEELLGGKDDECAAARVSNLQAMPFMAWLRLPHAKEGIGSIVDIFAAEVMAASEGHRDLAVVRDRARSLLMMTGNGRLAIGDHGWVWKAVRSVLHSRQDHLTAVSTLGSMESFDQTKTIGELSKFSIARPDVSRVKLARIRAQAIQQALRGTNGDAAKAKELADDFVEQILAILPPPRTTVRDLLVSSLVSQGVEEVEIRDEYVLADLTRLALFRNQLQLVAEETGKSFSDLKRVPMNTIPTFVINEAFSTHRQVRDKLPGSNVHDRHLAVLAAYCDVLYVDRRTAEDLLRLRRKEPHIDALMGEIAKGSDFEALLIK